MASWMVHLRIADKLLGCLDGIAQTEFVVGNIAPDSGLPNEDWTAYTPDKALSHFYITREDGKAKINVRGFIERYLTKELQQSYTMEKYSFYLGYLAHLLTDIEWIHRIYRPGIQKYAPKGQEKKHKLVWAMKADWYDLDFLYLKKHPDFRAFQIYENAEGFVNSYMDIFSPEAFDRRRSDIVSFYRDGRENLEREYPYLTEKAAEEFVKDCAKTVLGKLTLLFTVGLCIYCKVLQ